MKPIKTFLFALSIIFLVAFPKGGVKLGGIPLTWGYLILLIVGPLYFFSTLKTGTIYFTKMRRQSLMFCLPFILYSGLIITLVPNEGSLGFLFSYILSVLVMPVLFLVFLNKIIDTTFFAENFNKIFINSVRFVVVFGLVIFFQRRLTGSNIEIPYLTVNIDDLGTLDEKFNMRGDFMKFTSTYNNGNIYGACMLILMPLYFQIEKVLVLKLLFLGALVLTFSRTAWIGIMLYYLLTFFSDIKTMRGWLILIGTVLTLIILLPILLTFAGLNFNFLTDSNLGGRADYLKYFDNPTFFGVGTFAAIVEIVYASMFKNFGIIGLALFFLYISSPLIAYYTNSKLKNNKNNRAHWGLIIYIIISASDGAMLFIPTMAFFWFIASLALKSEKLLTYAR